MNQTEVCIELVIGVWCWRRGCAVDASGPNISTTNQAHGEVRGTPEPPAFQTGGQLSVPILRDIAATLHQIDARLARLETVAQKLQTGCDNVPQRRTARSNELETGSDWNIVSFRGQDWTPGMTAIRHFGNFAATRLDRRRRGDAHGEARAGGARRRQRAPAPGGRDPAAGHLERRRRAGAGAADHVVSRNSGGARMRRICGPGRDLRAADERLPIAEPERAARQRPGTAHDHRRRAGGGLGRAAAVRWNLIFGKWSRRRRERARMRST